MKLFFFDIESTGTDPQRHGIHQISGAIEIDGEIKEEFDFKVQPNVKLSYTPKALEVGKVTKEQIMAYPPMLEVYNKLIALLGKYVDKFKKTDKFFLVGYNNASFDNPFLRAWFEQNLDEYFGSWFWSSPIDVIVLATEFLKERRHLMPDFKLMTVAKELGIQIDESLLHDAKYDIYLTIQIYRIITKKVA